MDEEVTFSLPIGAKCSSVFIVFDQIINMIFIDIINDIGTMHCFINNMIILPYV